MAGRGDLQRVRADWATLGSADPLWAVLVDPAGRHNKWDPAEFLATGQAEVDAVLAHADTVGLHPERATALDFGCGAGRLTQALAGHFARAVGVDISPGMLATARQLDATGRCDFVQNEVADLRRFADGSFDVVLSSLVLQHLPPALAEPMLGELLRVLRPGGVAIIQVASRPDRSARGVLERVAPRAALRFAQRRILRYPAPMEMHAMSPATVERIAAAAGVRIAEAVDDRMYGGHWHYTRYYLART